MYAPPGTRMDDETAIAAFIAAHPFATLCVNGPDGPVAAHVPLVAETGPDGRVTALIGHVARANPFHEAVADAGTPALAVFRGADAYVSPSLYPSKAEHGRVVPTWAYLAAEARGILSVERDPSRMEPHITPLTDVMESHRANPWSVSDAPADYLARMTAAIVGVRLNVTALTGKRKLNQTKAEPDFNGVMHAFAASPLPAERALAAEMQKERP